MSALLILGVAFVGFAVAASVLAILILRGAKAFFLDALYAAPQRDGLHGGR